MPRLGATFVPGGFDDYYMPEVLAPAPQRWVKCPIYTYTVAGPLCPLRQWILPAAVRQGSAHRAGGRLEPGS